MLTQPERETITNTRNNVRPKAEAGLKLSQSGAGVPPSFLREDGSRDGHPTSDKRTSFDNPAKLFFAAGMVGSILGLGRLHLLEFDGEAIQPHDSEIKVVLFPDLILLKLH